MKKIFNKIFLLIFLTSLSLFIVLIIAVLSIGPSKTEDSIKALFNAQNYTNKYYEYSVIGGDATLENYTYADTSALNISSRQILDLASSPPLLVPSEGVAPRSAFLFTGPLSEGKHEGIDIWTNPQGTGMDPNHYGKGNPVYAACTGTVKKVWKENGDVSIICDTLSSMYEGYVPSLNIKTLYGHMADQFSTEVYIYVVEGQRVQQGDLIGHQGNRCFWAPQNRVVHLHFGIYDISKPIQVPLDPTPYIGVSCTTLNQQFTVTQNNNYY